MPPLAHIPPLVLLGGLVVTVFGPLIGLYALMTSGRRRVTHEIRNAARARGWGYRPDRWQGNPAAFRIDGTGKSGLAWTLSSGNSSESTHGWSTEMAIRFPALGGEPDFAIMPRDEKSRSPRHGDAPVASPLLFGNRARTGRATRLGFLLPTPLAPRAAARELKALESGSFPLPGPEARAFPAGEPVFDGLYQVFALPRQFPKPPVDRAFAQRILGCPADAAGLTAFPAPKTQAAPGHFVRVLMMRARFGLYCQARLPGPPDWATVTWFVALAEDCAARLPPAVAPTSPPSSLDRILDAFLR